MKTIAFAQQKGGSGKSTLGIHLATALSHMKFKVKLLDLDHQQTIYNWWNEKKTAAFSVETCSLQPLLGERVPQVLLKQQEAQQQKYDFLILDLPGTITAGINVSIKASDLAIIPITPSNTDIKPSLEIVSIATRLTPPKPYIYIINQAPSLGNHVKSVIDQLKLGHHNIADTSIKHRVVYMTAMHNGETIYDIKTKAKDAIEEMNSFASEVLSLLKIKRKHNAK